MPKSRSKSTDSHRVTSPDLNSNTKHALVHTQTKMTDADQHDPAVVGSGHDRAGHGERRGYDRPTRTTRHLMSLGSHSSSSVKRGSVRDTAGVYSATARCGNPNPWDDDYDLPLEQPWHRRHPEDDNYYDAGENGDESDYYSSQEDNDDDDSTPIDVAGPVAVPPQSWSLRPASLAGSTPATPEQQEATTSVVLDARDHRQYNINAGGGHVRNVDEDLGCPSDT